jgi:RimJ/RimL family protein N-acetyltransferase
MNIYGELSVLRACEPKDFDEYKKIYGNAETADLQFNNRTEDLNATSEDWCRSVTENRSSIMLTITDKNDLPSGFLHVYDIDWKNGSVRLDIAADPDADKQCYIKDALVSAVNFIFNHIRFETVVVYCLDGDTIKKSLLEEIGFIQDALLKNRIARNGKRPDVALYSLLPGDLNHIET